MEKVTAFQDPGYIVQDTEDSQLQEELPESSAPVVDNYTIPTVRAATVVGLQECGEGIWVFNNDVHINAAGTAIPSESSPYVWLGKFYPSQQGYDSASLSVIKDDNLSANVVLPLHDSAVVNLIEGLRNCYDENFPATLLLLGSTVIANHYEALYNRFQKIPATLAYGEVNCGKTTATKAALSMVGAQNTNLFKAITDAKGYKWAYTLNCTLHEPVWYGTYRAILYYRLLLVWMHLQHRASKQICVYVGLYTCNITLTY